MILKKINHRVLQLKLLGVSQRSMYENLSSLRATRVANTPCTPWFFILVLVIILSGCVRSVSHDGLLIAVSIPPQAWFVSQIADDKADTIVLVPPGQNPHNYEPTPRQIRSLVHASAWVLSGSEFEISLRPKIEALFPNLLIIDGTQGVEFRFIEEQCTEHDHTFLELDSHTWLGREPAKILAEEIYNVLSLIDNENRDFYFENYKRIFWEIEDLFTELKVVLAPLKGKSIFVYHPSFGYFLDEFGIYQEAVETGGKEPTPRQLNSLIAKITEEKPAAIFVQAQFPVNAAKTIAESANAELIELDPLAQDWFKNIIHMSEALIRAIP